MKVLVFGSRTWRDAIAEEHVLDGMYDFHKGDNEPFVIVHGAAQGADEIADGFARANGIPRERYSADWDLYGKAAGAYRNEYMLLHGNPDVAWGFVDKDLLHSKGSHDMAMKCVAAGVPTYIVQKL